MAEDKPEPAEPEVDALSKRFADYASFFHNSDAGQRILGYLKESLDGPTYRPGMDPQHAAYLAGRRSVYLAIVHAVGEGIEVIETQQHERPTVGIMPNSIEDL